MIEYIATHPIEESAAEALLLPTALQCMSPGPFTELELRVFKETQEIQGHIVRSLRDKGSLNHILSFADTKWNLPKWLLVAPMRWMRSNTPHVEHIIKAIGNVKDAMIRWEADSLAIDLTSFSVHPENEGIVETILLSMFEDSKFIVELYPRKEVETEPEGGMIVPPTTPDVTLFGPDGERLELASGL